MVFDNFKFGANFESNILNKTSILHNDKLLVIPQYECNQEIEAIIINNINNFNNSYNITSVTYTPFYEADDSSEYFLLNIDSKSYLTFINSDLTRERRIIFKNIYLINSYDFYNNDPIKNGIDEETITDIGIDLESVIYLSPTPIVDISIGNEHSLFLDNLGKVYSYGNRKYGEFETAPNYGQLGRTSANFVDYINPMKITQNIGDVTIVAISAGFYHSLFLDNLGNVYSCGYGGLGALGHGNTTNYNFPTKITENIGDSNIVAISAGYQHSLFLDNLRNVYSCGYNAFSQLGHGTATNYTVPTLIDALAGSNITHISAGFWHSLFLNEDGKVYSCGTTGYGRLGRTGGDNKIPQQITYNIGNSNITHISAGHEHSLFLNEDKKVYSCGYGGNGELGHGDTNNYYFPTLIDALNGSNITHISAGSHHSLFVEDSTSIYRCGLDLKLEEQPEPPRRPYIIDDINRNNIVNISANKNIKNDVLIEDDGSATVYQYLTINNSEYKYFIIKNASGNYGTGELNINFLYDTYCDILIIGGGGGGGYAGRGGGAGGLLYMVNTGPFEKATKYKIVVGQGGGIDTEGSDSYIVKASDNSQVSFEGKDLIGKGGGSFGRDGGSGGAAGRAGSSDQTTYPQPFSREGGSATQGNTFWNGSNYVAGGHAGGKGTDIFYSGGGGGAGGAGGNDGSNGNDVSGPGRQVDITGTNITYGKGGNYVGGADGGANTGNGGGGGNGGGVGGSGVVIIRYYKPTTQFLYTSSTIYKHLVESLPNTQKSIVTDTNNLTVWNQNKALIKYIDGFIINNYIYLIHKSGKIITKLDTSYTFNESFNIDSSINIEDDNDVVSINVNTDIYIIIGYLNKIIKFNINTTTPKTIEIEDYYYTEKKFSKAIYSYIDNKIYLIPYNIPQLGVIDITATTFNFNFISLTYDDKNIFELQNISRLFSDAIQYNQYIYMIPESSQYIYIYNVLNEKVINVFDISIYNENNYDKSYTFSSAFLSDLGTNFNNIVLIPYSSFNIGIITYDISDNNPNLDIAPNFNVISFNIFSTPNDDSEYYLIANLDIDVGAGEIYKTNYTRGTTNFQVSNTNKNIILHLKSNFPNITFTNHHIIEYKFSEDISDTRGIFNLSNHSGNDDWQSKNILTLEDPTNKIKYLNKSFSDNKLSIAFTVKSLPEVLSEFFRYSNSTNDDGIVLKADASELEIQIQSLVNRISCSSDHKFVLIIDNSNITLYENTKFINLDNDTLNSNLNINNFDIFEFGSENFNGTITNFNIFNIDLNDNEITHLYDYDYEYIADLFLRNDNESFFNDIYQLDVNLDSKYTTKYPTINFQQDFITSNQINALFINNIYSIENNIVYFIPYNHKYILELNLDSSIIRQIDISSTHNAFLLNTFINNDNISKFNNSIILHNKLYLLPYSKHNDFLPLIIYDFDYDDTASVYLTVDIINILDEVEVQVGSDSELFCVFLYYYGDRNKYLLLIKNESSHSFSFNIENKNIEQINDTSQDGYIDGYIDGNTVYLLQYTGQFMRKCTITESGDSLTFSSAIADIDLRDNGRRHTKRFSKMLFHNIYLYLIPYDEYRICRYNTTNNTFKYIDITGITSSEYNTQLFNGGAILNYNNTTYIVMVPFKHTALCIYDIKDDGFIFINDPIFETNQFIGCCVDLKGNIYMNTHKGDVLYYSLSLVRQYNFISSPVVFGTTGTTITTGTTGTTEPINTREISLKNLYKKFHKNYIYNNYNFNNAQIKFSDYYNDGGAEYFTNEQLNINKFVTNAGITISNVHYDTTPDLSYNEFVSLQSEHCNELTLHPFLNITKNRCEYYTPSQNNYKINAVDILSTELYYSSTDSNYDVEIYKINSSTNNPELCIRIPFIQTSAKNDIDINIPATISNKPDYDLLPDTHPTINDGINTISSSEINELNINIYSNIDLELDLSNLIIKDIFSYLSSINITFDSTYVVPNNLYIYNGINILMNTVSNKYLRSLNNITITIKNNVFFDNNDTLKKLIQISSNNRVTHIQTITILEDYNSKELYLHDHASFTRDIITNNNNYNYKKINKIIYKISATTTTNIDLGNFSEFHYLKDIIVIIDDSAYTLTISGSLKQKCNIIIFSNINDQESSSALIDDSPVFYSRPSLLKKQSPYLLPPIALPLQVQATSLIYKFAYNPNVELPAESIFDLKYDDNNLPFFNQYNVDFNKNSDTFLKNDEINFTIKKISFWFYLLNNNPDNHLLSLYNDAEEVYLTLMIDSTSKLVIKTNLVTVTTATDITVESAPIINNWYYIENLFNFLTELQQTEYTDNTKLLNKITLNLGNLQAAIKEDINPSFNFKSHCKIGYLKVYKKVSENNFRKYLDFSESPVYQENFIQYKFNGDIEPKKNEYIELPLPQFNLDSESDDYVVNNYFINFNTNISLPTTEIKSCLSIWFNINQSDVIDDNYLLIYKNRDPLKSLHFILSSSSSDEIINLDIFTYNVVYKPIEISGNTWLGERRGHTMVVLSNKIYIFGGLERISGVSSYLNDFYEIDIEESTSTQINDDFNTETEILPPKRSGHTMVVMNNKIYIFGGLDLNSDGVLSRFNDFYEIDVTLYPRTSKRINDDFETETLPSGRNGHTMVVLNNKIYIFGGYGLNSDGVLSRFNDFYEIDVTLYPPTSKRINDDFETEILPSERHGHTMVVLNNKIYIFGGFGINSVGVSGYLNDFYEIDIEESTSTQINDDFDTETEILPTARSGHTMVVMNNKIYIFGGFGLISVNPYQFGDLNDFYEIDVTLNPPISKRINNDNSDTTLPPKRSEHTMVVLSNKIYIFGGDGLTGYLNDFYKIEIDVAFPAQAQATISLFPRTDIKWFNLVLAKNNADKYDIYIDNVFGSTLFYNTSNYYELEFNSNSDSVIQNVKTADLRLYNELLIDSNLLSGIYYDNEILKFNSIRYRFGDNNAENNNSNYKLLESEGSEIIYDKYYVSFKENEYLELENSYNTKLLSISFCLNTINSKDTYHLISLSNVNNCNLEFFIHDFRLSSIQDSKITTIEDYIDKNKWYNLILEEQNTTKIYIDNYSNDSYDYSLDSLNYLRIGNISNIVNIANIDTIHSRLYSVFSSTELTITGTLPSERNGHTMVVLNNKIYIFGGFGLKSDGQLGHLNDFYEIDIEQSTSTELNITGTLPTKRHQHTMVVLNDKIYIFGGYGINSVGVNSWLNDFYEIDIEQSTSTELTITITGTLPTKRHQHTMVVLNNKIYIFGGFSGINGVFSNFNDFYEIDIEQSTSTELTITGTLPSARNEHTMVVLNNKIYIFGGFGGTHLNNFYKIDIEQSTSTELNISGTLPTARKEHTMVVTMDNKIYIFGGYGRNSNGEFSYLNDFYKIEIDSDKVTSTELIILGTLPPKRSEHTMVVLDNKIYIFGGIFGASTSTGYHLNDFHELTFIPTTGYDQFNGKYDQFDGKIADLQLYNREYLNTSINRDGIYSNLLYYKP